MMIQLCSFTEGSEDLANRRGRTWRELSLNCSCRPQESTKRTGDGPGSPAHAASRPPFRFSSPGTLRTSNLHKAGQLCGSLVLRPLGARPHVLSRAHVLAVLTIQKAD